MLNLLAGAGPHFPRRPAALFSTTPITARTCFANGRKARSSPTPQAAMMDAHNISAEDVQLTKDEAAMLHVDPPDLKDPHGIKWRLTYQVGVFCNVQIYRSRHQTGLKCIGMPSDVQLAMWLLDTLADFVFAELYGHLIGCCAPNNERRVIIRSFVEACC
jgi:hypothetical protein